VGNHWIRKVAGAGPVGRRGGDGAADRLGTVLDLPTGRVLCAEGTIASQWFLLLRGAVAVTSGGRLAGTLTPGEWFGSTDPDAVNALLAATATALTDVRVLVLDRDEYRALAWMRPPGEVRIAAPRASDAIA
jgi:CRP-like cAMP-binding protein